MSLPIKLGLGTVGTAGAATTAYYGLGYLVSVSEDKPQENPMPEWRPLSQDSDIGSYSSGYGNKYARLLVGVGTAESSASVKDNKGWWDWTYQKFYKSNEAKGKFKGANSGSKGSDGNSLQEKCGEAYKQTADQVKNDSVGDGDFSEEQVWLFCSPGGKKPKSISEVDSGEDKTNVESSWKDKFGGKNKDYLLSISAGENEEIWKQLDKQAKSNGSKPSSGFFSTDSNGVDIKAKCKSAYDRGGDNDATSDKPSEEGLYKWCSLKGSKTTNP